MESSLRTPSHATVSRAHAAPSTASLRRASTSPSLSLQQPGRRRAHAMSAHSRAPEPEPKGAAKEALPRTTALRVGAGVALALALGGASWAAPPWRGGGAGTALVQPNTMVCALNAVADGAERGGGGTPAAVTGMRTSVDALSDSLFRREDAPRDRATLMDLVFEQVTKEHIGDRGKLTSLLQKEWAASRDSERKLDLGLLLTDVLVNQREWQRAKEVCQQLTGRYQRDSRPYLHLAVINMMMAVETMLSPETATADDIEKMSKNAMDAWKEFKNKYELAKGATKSGA